MKKIVLFGAGGHAKSCIDVIEQEKKFKIIYLVDNLKKKINNYNILSEKKFEKNTNKKLNLFIAIGQIKSSLIRKKIYLKLLKKKFTFPKIISPRAYVSKKSQILEGTIIMHDCLVNSGSKIGKFCIINSKSLIEHDVKISNFCHISTKVVVNGNCNIGEGTFIGSGSILHNNVKIGKNCIIAAGSIIKKNIKDNKIIYGK